MLQILKLNPLERLKYLDLVSQTMKNKTLKLLVKLS